MATLFAGLFLLALSGLGFVFVVGDAHERHVSTSAAVRLLLISGLIGASIVATMSYRLLHKTRRLPTDRGHAARTRSRAGVGIGFGVATVLLALTGPVSYVLYGLLFGVVAAFGLIAFGRAAVALSTGQRKGDSA